MIYLYGLLTPSAPRPELDINGVTGAVLVETLPQGHLVYSFHEGGEILAKRRLMLAHTRVIEALLEIGTVLPMRFGMIADTVSAISTLLASQSSHVHSQFAKLEGQVELGVRLTYPKEPALAHQLTRHPQLAQEHARLSNAARKDHFQIAEFGRKVGEALERHRTDIQRALVANLKEVVSDLVLRVPETEYQVLHASVLLPQSSEKDFGETLIKLAQQYDFAPDAEPDVQLVGPAPMYNFVNLSLSDSAQAA